MKLLSSYSAFLVLAVLSFVQHSHSQSSVTGNGQAATTPFATTFISTNIITVNNQKQTQEITITETITPSAQPTSNGNSSNSNSNSNSNSTNSNHTSSSSTPSNLPTANPSVNGGGNPGGLAPSPGGNNGLYGPGDNFIAGALVIHVNIALMTLAGVAVGATMIL